MRLPRWPSQERELWHPDSPGGRVRVEVLWPRYLWLKGPDAAGRPSSFATLGETLRMYRRNRTR